MEVVSGKPKVLYIEDDEIAIMYVSRILQSNFFVSAAKDSDSAFNLLRNQHIDIILMDINLGRGESGVELAKKITSIEGYEKVPIIALTAFAMQRDKEFFLQEGFTSYLSKPFKSPELIDLIFSVLRTNGK